MAIPEPEIEHILFRRSIDTIRLRELEYNISSYDVGKFQDIHWLNTPGPIYTTCTDNCGTGQIEALNNVGGDQDYREIIFKPPFTYTELKETLNAAAVDPFDAYYFDGNEWWNEENIIAWWNKSEERINYIIDRYEEELHLPENPHITSVKIGDKIFTGHFFGPIRPIPENYKYWLDFYQFGMKGYLEWYIYTIHQQKTTLPTLDFNWAKKEGLDNFFKSKSLSA